MSCDVDKARGWLLDIYQSGPGKIALWLITAEGRRVKLEDDFYPKIYIAGPLNHLKRLKQTLEVSQSVHAYRFAEKYVKPGDLERTRVLEVEVLDQRRAVHFARKIMRLGRFERFEVYNVDLPAEQYYLYDHSLYPFALIDVTRTRRGLWIQLLEDPSALDYQLPPLRRVLLGVEAEGRLLPSEKVRRIIVKTRREKYVLEGGDEAGLILEFVKLLVKLDPDFIFTKGGDSTVLQYLTRRAMASAVYRDFYLSRDKHFICSSRQRGRTVYSYGRAYFIWPTHRLHGRIHIDLLNSFILANSGFHGLAEVARTCRVELHRAARAGIGTIMSSLQLYEAIKSGVLIPWRKKEPEDYKDALTLLEADRGGLVLEPILGVHRDVGEVDFSSMYPYIMLKYNISPETINCQCCPDSPQLVPELGFRVCQRRRGLIPRVLEVLLRRRLAYKRMAKEAEDPRLRKIYDRRQAALKWVLVSCFGYLGYRNAKFGRVEAHQAVCAYARELLLKAIEIAEERGFEVIHGIVDSLWVKKPGASQKDYEELTAQIHKETGMPIGLEGIYRWIAFLRSRSTPTPALTRYFGAFSDGRIKVRGLMARRSDTPLFIRQVQENLIKKLSEATSDDLALMATKALRKTEGAMEALRKRLIPLDLLVVRKRLSKEPYDYASQVHHAVAAKQL
ncbi:MAG: hypothetical protein DRN06_08950, partial [Thermoprotei archaeon]